MVLETGLLTGGLNKWGEEDWCAYNCTNTGVANMCRKTCDPNNSAKVAAAQNAPSCIVNDNYCTEMIKNFLGGYEFVRSDGQKKECIISKSNNITGKKEFFKIQVYPEEKCRTTYSLCNGPC